MEDLRRADDNFGILHYPAKEVLLHAVPTDRHQVVVASQVRLELVVVMLLYEMDLSNNNNDNNLIWPLSCSVVPPVLRSASPSYHVDQDDHLGIGGGLQVPLGHVHGSSSLPRSRRQPDDDVFTLQRPPDHLLLVGVQAQICHLTPAQRHGDRCRVNRAADQTITQSVRFCPERLTRQAGRFTQRLLVSPKCTRGEPVGLLNVWSAAWRRNENETRSSGEEAPLPWEALEERQPVSGAVTGRRNLNLFQYTESVQTFTNAQLNQGWAGPRPLLAGINICQFVCDTVNK